MIRLYLPLFLGCVFCGFVAGSYAQRPLPSNKELASPQLERKVDALLRQMTLTEKIGQLVQYNATQAHPAAPDKKSTAALNVNPPGPGGVDSYELAQKGELGSMLNTVGQDLTNHFQHAAVDQTRLHIPLLFGADVVHGFRTIFPVPLATASSWDTELITEMARTAAVEARTAGVNWFYSPMVDIARDPRWGRCTEGAGEDPYLGSVIARAYIRGYQGKSLGDRNSVAASVKHYAAYGAAEAGRDYNTTDMSDLLLRQVYLAPYRAAAQEGAATFMSAFNSLNGVPASANPYLMQTILREEWGFNGFIVSDYTAVMELIRHGIALNAADATEKALKAGVDIDMNAHFYDTELPALVKSGKVPMAVVDEAVRRILRVKFALGLFEHPFTEGPEVTRAVPEHRPLARRAAEESFVLLQNKPINGKPLLPMAGNGRNIALIGPLADNAPDMVGAWSGANNFDDVRTLRQSLTEAAQQEGFALAYAKGTDISGNSNAGFEEAVAAAEEADVVIMALGESSDMSGEAASRTHLDLPGNQQALLEAVQATGKPIVLLVFSGRPLVLKWASEHVPAVMEVWFPGMETGPAITNVLFGKTAPSGKLTMSFPQSVGQVPIYYNRLPTGRPIQYPDPAHPDAYVEKKYVSRYLDESNDPLFPFGHGLTYTTFAYKDIAISGQRVNASALMKDRNAKPVMASAVVTNTGEREGTEVVQCYINIRGASTEQPVRSLQGFARVTLKPGESRKIEFPLGFEELSFYNAKSQQVIEPAEYTVFIGGSSLADQAAHFVTLP
ncbi:MAG: beta-glucosidase [Acidobacteriaceae bacterium]|nr:beta-glucosidase [Acidobacteriaceae bacterium]